MQWGILRDPESQRRHDSKKTVGSRSLEGSSTLGRLVLEGLLLFVYSNFILQWIDLPLGGQRRGFSPSSSFSSSITRLGVILWLHLSSLTLVLYFYCLLFMLMHQSSYRCIVLHLLLFCTQISQSKSNLAIIFYWESKQALVFSHKFELFRVFLNYIQFLYLDYKLF